MLEQLTDYSIFVDDQVTREVPYLLGIQLDDLIYSIALAPKAEDSLP